MWFVFCLAVLVCSCCTAGKTCVSMITYLFDYYIFFIYFNLWKSDSSSCHCQTNVQMLWGFHVYLNVNTVRFKTFSLSDWILLQIWRTSQARYGFWISTNLIIRRRVWDSVDFHMPNFFFLIWPHGFIYRKMALKYANYTFPSVKLPLTIVMNSSLVWGVHTYWKWWLSKYLMVLIFLQASEHPATLWLLPRCLSCVPHPGVCTQGRAVQRAPALWAFSREHKRHGKSAELRPFRHSCCSII